MVGEYFLAKCGFLPSLPPIILKQSSLEQLKIRPVRFYNRVIVGSEATIPLKYLLDHHHKKNKVYREKVCFPFSPVTWFGSKHSTDEVLKRQQVDLINHFKYHY